MQLLHNVSNSTDIFVRNAIEDTFENYLEEFHIKSIKELKDNDVSSPKEIILLAATRDFVNFRIDFDLFISILGMIWIVDPEIFEPSHQTHVEKLCFNILDLQWYLRHDPERNIKSLSEVLTYYQNNKEKIGGIKSFQR